MLPKPLSVLSADDLLALVSEGVEEGRTLEYKEILPDFNAQLDKQKFLSNVSSFANAAGGDIIFGVRAERGTGNRTTGRAAEIIGLSNFNPDHDITRIESIISTGIEPVLRVSSRPISGFPLGSALVIRVPQSWAGPHMVTPTGRFYSRTSTGKFLLDVHLLREAFVRQGSISERSRRFRDERLAHIIADETPAWLIPSTPRLIVLSVPMSALSETGNVSFTLDRLRAVAERVGHDSRMHTNIDGLLLVDASPQPDAIGQYPAVKYIQIFRNGVIEMVHAHISYIDNGDAIIYGGEVEETMLGMIDRLIGEQRRMGFAEAIVVYIALAGVGGYRVEHPLWYNNPIARLRLQAVGRRIDRNLLVLPELLIEDHIQDVGRILKAHIDMIYQASGHDKSPSFDASGQWSRSGW